MNWGIKNISKIITKALVVILLLSKIASAEEITAIDFNGDMLGKVIPDGKVVSFDNQLIGNVTADSLILSFEGDLIGGVVPQGIAIGNDNKVLGKVSNDGSVRLASGKIVGKTLPNGLVVSDSFEVIGAVLFPGLIYSDSGKTVGRLTGDGAYTNLQGQVAGFISPDGYAYRKVGADYVLDGRLISSKMVVSETGDFIGSVTPGGAVTNFESSVIGFVRANGFVYNESSRVIGKIVKNAYAFDLAGKYIGFVTYNGEVVSKDQLVGRAQADGRIIDNEGKLVGYSTDIAATATDLVGRYLGRVMPRGDVVRARDIVGKVSTKGLIVDSTGNVIGQVVQSGPVFDYKGTIRAHSLRSGGVILPEGSLLGYTKGRYAFDSKGRIIGGTLEDSLAISLSDNPLGLNGISGVVYDGEEAKYISPFGYVFSADGALAGASKGLDDIYSLNGSPISYLSLNGELLHKGNVAPGKITQSGINLDERNRILGKIITAVYAVVADGLSQGILADNNLILDKASEIIAKILPDDSTVLTTKDNSIEISPKAGEASSNIMAYGFVGDLLGYVSFNGIVKDFSNITIGRVASGNQVVDNSGVLIGQTKGFSSVVESCKLLGVLSPRGDIRNYREIAQGYLLLNDQAITENGDVVGYSFRKTGVVDANGNILGAVSSDGNVLNYAGESLGCINKRGLLINSEGSVIGSSLDYTPVMNYNGAIVGRIILDGTVTNDVSQIIGYVQPNGNVNSKTGNSIGHAFKYKVAFDTENKYLGRVLEDGKVVGSDNKELGVLDFEGNVVSNGQLIGYALYDMYMYDNNFNTIGYIAKDGNVISFSRQNLGRLDRGFLINKDQKVFARGNRDFYIRDDNHIVLGELSLEGNLIDSKGSSIGKLEKEGAIFGANNQLLSVAKPLQYYDVISNRPKVYNEDGKLIGYVSANDVVVDENGKPIGILKADGTVVSANGNVIGGVGVDWYERVDYTPPAKDLPEVGVGPEDKEIEEKSRKSFNIALTPDGEYLGEILDDGRVVNDKGQVIGRKMPDGLIIDDDGTLIGIEESQKPTGDGMFVPAGTFGPGSAYGTGSGTGGNLGPGGGFGPGERYDPQRSAALSAAQEERRKNISVGKISSGIRKESIDGMQKDWNEQGVTKSISSWRVDMSEMILADKPIPAVISRSIDSNNPTPITAFVERNVYAEVGRNIIIPAGSRLLGTMGSMVATTESNSQSAKVQITWERLLRPDGSMFTFQGITADAQGRGGALGYLDQQLFKRYTLPIMTTALTSYTSYMMAPKDQSDGTSETPRQQAANDARQNFLNEMNQIFEQILRDKTNIKPLTYVPAGTRIIVFPNVDLWLRSPERDKEAQVDHRKRDTLIDDKEIKEERAAVEVNKKQNQGSVSSSSSVLYEADEAGVQATGGGTKLMDDNQIKQQRLDQQKRTTTGTPPPPPPSNFSVTPSTQSSGSSSTTSNSGSSSGSSSSSNSSGVPQLF